MDSIVVAYDNPGHAADAIAALLRAGVPAQSIHRHVRDGDTLTADSHLVVHPKHTNIWDVFIPGAEHEEKVDYVEPESSDGTVIRVSMIPEGHYDSVMNILAQFHPVEVRAHSAE